MAALIAAYNDGEEWLNEAIAYVSGNKAYLEKFLQERIPQIRMIPSEGTYLVWLDCSQPVSYTHLDVYKRQVFPII